MLELFINLDATEEQLDYPILYASAKEGWASESKDAKSDSIYPLLDKIVSFVPPPAGNRSDPFSMLITQVESDPYVGKCYLGKIQSGTLKVGDKVTALDGDKKVTSEGKCQKIFLRQGLKQSTINEAGAGDIVSIAGIENAMVNQTICDPVVQEPLPVRIVFH